MACGTITVASVVEEAEEQGKVALGQYMGLSRVNREGSMCFLQIIGVVCLCIGLSVVGRRGSTIGRHMYEAVKFCLLRITRGGGGLGGVSLGPYRVAALGALAGAAQKERAEAHCCLVSLVRHAHFITHMCLQLLLLLGFGAYICSTNCFS